MPLLLVISPVNLRIIYVQNSKWSLHGWNKWERSVVTLAPQGGFSHSGFRISEPRTLSLYVVGSIFYSGWGQSLTSPQHWLSIQVSHNQSGRFAPFFWLCCDFHRHSSGILQFSRRDGIRSFLTLPLLSEVDAGVRGIWNTTWPDVASALVSKQSRIICRLKMNAVLFCLCATSMRLITQLLITFLAEPHW